jgi:hypothetical protein
MDLWMVLGLSCFVKNKEKAHIVCFMKRQGKDERLFFLSSTELC